MRINELKVVGKEFAYDVCHKMYILESEKDKQEVLSANYKILPIGKLENTYH